jgi:hypothetical protein
MAPDTCAYQGFIHAGAGTSQVLILLSVMIPGLLPTLALLGVISAVLVVPVVALGLAATLAIAPTFGLWRLATRGRRRRRRARRPAGGTSATHRVVHSQHIQIRSAT